MVRKQFSFKAEDVDLLRHFKWLFILDGLDELAQKLPLHLVMNATYWPSSFFVMTARSGFLQGSSDVQEYLTPRHPMTKEVNATALDQIYLLPFSDKQLD